MNFSILFKGIEVKNQIKCLFNLTFSENFDCGEQFLE